MSLLICDTNVIFDLIAGNLLRENLLRSTPLYVPRPLFENEMSQEHGSLEMAKVNLLSWDDRHQAFLEDLMREYLLLGRQLRKRIHRVVPKTQKCLALWEVMLREESILLTGDKVLREQARRHGVKVHGTLWLVGLWYHRELLDIQEVMIAFDRMKRAGRRQPWTKIKRILERWDKVDGERLSPI